MDGTSTLVLEGQADNFPTLHVNDSATLDGILILRISISPTNFPPPGVWQNFTIIICHGQCRGSFQKVIVSHVGSCGVIEDVGEDYVRESRVSVAVLFAKEPICVAPAALPPIVLCGIVIILFLYRE